jgi:hypothetical protein
MKPGVFSNTQLLTYKITKYCSVRRDFRWRNLAAFDH